jgi:polyferredoxin
VKGGNLVRKKRTTTMVRFGILLLILVGSMVVHYLHSLGGPGYPSVHSICPYGGLEGLWALLSGQANISKIYSGTFALFILTVLFAILFRRSFCGKICPFGALQELIGWISPKKIKVPKKVDQVLSKLKYVLLGITILMAWVTATLWMSPYDPWAAFSHIYKGEELLGEFLVGTILLIVTVATSLFVKRSFCRYLCPAGAFYALLGKISPYKVVREDQKCTSCGICTKACPVDIEVHTQKKITTAECISCNECVTVCPKSDGMIGVSFGKKKIKPMVALLSIVVLFFGSLMVLDAMGLYQVNLPTVEEIEEKKEYLKIIDLRGSMTIEQGAFYTGKTLEAFYEIMEIPPEVPKDTLLKYVNEYVPGYDFHAMKAKK